MKCSESKAITLIIFLLSVVPLCLVDGTCECGDGLQPVVPSNAIIEHSVSYNGSFDNCEDNPYHYQCSNHQLFNCSTDTEQNYEWSEGILLAFFTNPLQQVKIWITYFILNASNEAEITFLQYNGTLSEYSSATVIPLPSNKQQLAIRLPSAGFDRISISHRSTDGSVAIKKIIFCSEHETSELENIGSGGELEETLPTMMESTTGKEGSEGISSTAIGVAGGIVIIMILVVLAILVLVVRWSYKKRHNNSNEQDRVYDEVIDMKSNPSYDAINRQSHDEAKPSDHQYSYLIDPEELSLYEEGTIKMETNPCFQKSTGEGKADVVAGFERKASEPYVQPNEVYHKEDYDKMEASPTLEHTDKTTYITILPYI